MKTEFEVGDLVRSSAGGPPMVVEEVRDNGELACTYWTGRRFRIWYWPPECLRIATTGERDLARTRTAND